ncbi:MAG: MFS transporter [Vicinamibacterales bacterium]|nr:MFS transporter [Vicinamibacterales bacterium]
MAEQATDTPANATDTTTTTPLVWSAVLRRLAVAFTFNKFRNVWLAAFTSAVGTWVQRFAQQWLILSLTGSAFILGLNTFLAELPLLLFTLIGGVIADRHDRRHLLMGSQAVQMVCALTLAAIVFFDITRVRYILALSFISGLAQAFGGPAFQSLLPSLVPRQHLPNAIALNSIQFNLAQAIGPAIGGVVLVGFGMAACFGLNGLSFLVVIAVLGLMRVPPPAPATRQRILTELQGGLRYVRHGGALLALTVLAFATTSLALPVRAFLPVFADDAAHLSQMMTMLGAGAVVGALVVAWLGQFDHMGRTLLLVQVVFGGIVATFALLPITGFSYVLLFLSGVALLMIFSLTNSLVQLTVPDELRGRVISIYLVAFRGGMPLGSLISGYFITQFSAPTVIAANGLLLSLVAAGFLMGNRQVREL